MRLFLRVAKSISAVLLTAFLTELLMPTAVPAQDGPKATNVRFDISANQVIITYDLRGRADETYGVNLTLHKEKDNSRTYRPRLISGDVGRNVAPGEGRKIVWDLRKEIPNGLEGSGYYFVVAVEKEGSGFPWWTGAAVVGAGLIGLLVFSSGADQKDDEPSLPPPPGRP